MHEVETKLFRHTIIKPDPHQQCKHKHNHKHKHKRPVWASEDSPDINIITSIRISKCCILLMLMLMFMSLQCPGHVGITISINTNVRLSANQQAAMLMSTKSSLNISISDNKDVAGLRDSHSRVIASQSLACTSISFKDLPLLYETMGGSLNILLSNGCCCIKCQFCIVYA